MFPLLSFQIKQGKYHLPIRYFNTAEYREVLSDMQMLLQEKLYKVNDKSSLVINNMDRKNRDKSPEFDDNDNRRIIVKAAKSFGLTDTQINDLFQELEVDELGYYSINNAVPLILNKRTIFSPSRQTDLKSKHSVCSGSGVHVGTRVKTVFEDGSEHEGETSIIIHTCISRY